MISDLRSIERPGRVDPVAGVGAVREQPPFAPGAVEASVEDPFDGIPASPPAEVLEEVNAAFDRLQALRDRGLELRYDTSDGSRIRVDLVDRDGVVVRRVPPTEALELAAGADPVPTVLPMPVGFRVDREA